METDLNHCVLTGILERDPITRFADHDTQQVSFTLKLIEPGPAGKEFNTLQAQRGVEMQESRRGRDV